MSKPKIAAILFITAAALLGAAGFWNYKNKPASSASSGEVPATTQTEVVPENPWLGTRENDAAVAKREAAAPPPAGGTDTAKTAVCEGGDASNWYCYQDYYNGLVEGKSIAAAFADLKVRYNENDYIRAQCHPLAHVIGNAAAKKFASPGEAYLEGDSFCWSGYHHGVLEGIIGRIGLQNLPAQMDAICDKIHDKERYGFDYYNCVHGLGHGVMAVNDDQLFKALELCDELTGGWEQTSCASGVYMENVIIDNKNHHTDYLKPDDPLYPCNASPGRYKDTCYLMQTSYMLKINGGDFVKTFQWCSEAEEAHRNTCYTSLGRDASGRSTSNINQTHDACLLGSVGDQQTYCVIGAVKDFVSYFHSDVQARQLCESFAATDLKQTCLSTMEQYYKLF